MGQTEKFLFDVSFDDANLALEKEAARASIEQDSEPEAEEYEAPTFSEDEMEASRRDGFDAGKAEGVREAGDAVETQISDALAQLTAQFDTLFKKQAVANAEIFDDSIKTAITIVRKCFPHLTESDAPRAIEDMVREVLAEILEEPRAMVHVHPDLAENLNNRISEIAGSANFEGQVLIIDDEKTAPGDCRVTWSSGSAERDMEALWGNVDEIVEQNLKTVRQDVPTPVSESVAAENAQPMETAASEGPSNQQPVQQPEAPDTDAAPAPPPASVTTDDPGENQIEESNYSDINELDALDEGQDMDTAGPPETIEVNDAADQADQSSDMTGAHLQAGPGIVEEPPVEAILSDEQSEGEPTEELDENTDEAAEETMPPAGPNL